MDDLSSIATMTENDARISEIIAGERSRLVFLWIGGQAVMYLWNWLLPTLFGLRTVTFWQALGLLALCRILFGGFGMRGGGMQHSRFRRRMAERWDQMTPEEREKFCQGLHGRWGRTVS